MSAFEFEKEDLDLTSTKQIHFFNPFKKYSDIIQKDEEKKSILLYLSGVDGTGMGPWMQFPGLSKNYEIFSFFYPVDSMPTLQYLIDDVVGALREIRPTKRKVLVVGESFGGILGAAAVHKFEQELNEEEDFFEGFVMVNPATSFESSYLQSVARVIQDAPELVYNIGSLFVTFALFDLGLFWNIGKLILCQILSGGTGSVFEDLASTGPEFETYFQRATKSLTKIPTCPQEVFRWRMQEWLTAGNCYVSPLLHQIKTRTLVLAGSADSLLPSEKEARRLEKEMNASICIIEGAGHIGTLDLRINLAQIIQEWKEQKM